ncbi:dTDP-4-dehydrorhamnose 3,5-epimerase [Polynucleobacter sp. AP-Ainpum-60-G11]|uniref:dTDP-4-dehydrorhamnose 3,5-epimerase n=1 Tax=Polynucleobacter sp. AP-Ainpum-60-G11 TaxID=2576926 RepID=UPI001BFE44E2|nr:dTDP-4-dehydrorhamnose 3,5-epimerase [Polynucleobacter sp. AP-Ainpum-60-G11]QWE27020.1 dTDP-4-dehydrorhamnose 3,5-epimerase [Polynucleobacter sp. AP-Ainpum-60-G11]
MSEMEGIFFNSLQKKISNGGHVCHGLKSSDDSFCGYGEAYFSVIKGLTIRPWKLHNLMTLNLIVILGEVKFVVADLRNNSNTIGQTREFILNDNDRYGRLTVYPGIWVAMQGNTIGKNIILNIANIEHSEDEIVREGIDFINHDWGRE